MRRWLTDPDWLPLPPSFRFLPLWASRFLDARQIPHYTNPVWVRAGEMAGDCLRDLGTDDGTLSVFFIPDENPELVKKVGAALIANTDDVARFEYCSIRPETLRQLGLQTEPSPASGNTPDSEVNEFHYDVVELTASMVVRLAATLKQTCPRNVVTKDTIKHTLSERIVSGKIARNRVPKIVAKLGL